jgi:hypothetical protein
MIECKGLPNAESFLKHKVNGNITFFQDSVQLGLIIKRNPNPRWAVVEESSGTKQGECSGWKEANRSE